MALVVAKKPLKPHQNVAGAEMFVIVLREQEHVSGTRSVMFISSER